MLKRQTIWARAYSDTARVREHFTWFFTWELIGLAGFTAIGFLLTPESASKWEEALFPAGGAVLGGFLVIFLIYGWNLLWAASRQRNEAWAREDAIPEEAARRMAIKGLLGRRRVVMNGLMEGSDQDIEREGNATADFVGAAFGEGEQAAFEQGSVRPLFGRGGESEWQSRNRRLLLDLDALIARTDTITIRTDCNLKEWQEKFDATL